MIGVVCAIAGLQAWHLSNADPQRVARPPSQHITDLAKELQAKSKQEGLTRDPMQAEGAPRQDEVELEQIKRWHEARRNR